MCAHGQLARHLLLRCVVLACRSIEGFLCVLNTKMFDMRYGQVLSSLSFFHTDNSTHHKMALRFFCFIATGLFLLIMTSLCQISFARSDARSNSCKQL